MDILDTNYPLSGDPRRLSTDHHPPLLVHVVITRVLYTLNPLIEGKTNQGGFFFRKILVSIQEWFIIESGFMMACVR